MKLVSPSFFLRRFAVWSLLAISFVATASSALAGSYAAIAFDQGSGLYGYAKGYATRAAAEEKALQECGGRNAKIVMWSREGVITLAVGDTRGAYGTGHDNRRKVAQNQAVDNCDKYTTNSHVVITIDTRE